MIDSYIEPEDYKEHYCLECETLNYRIQRTHEDFFYIIDVVQGNLPYDEEQWKDSLKLLNELFGYDQPLLPPIFARQSNMQFSELDCKILRQTTCI